MSTEEIQGKVPRATASKDEVKLEIEEDKLEYLMQAVNPGLGSSPMSIISSPKTRADEIFRSEELKVGDVVILPGGHEEESINPQDPFGLKDSKTKLEEVPEPDIQESLHETTVSLEDLGFPAPTKVMMDMKRAQILEFSPTMSYMKIFRYVDIISMSQEYIVDNASRSKCDAYTILMLKTAQEYYENLPQIGYSLPAFEVLHSFARTSQSLGVQPLEGQARNSREILSSRGLDYLCVIASNVMISAAWAADPMLNVKGHSELLNDRVDYVLACNKRIYTIYNMIGHCCTIGRLGIDPVFPLLPYSAELRDYIMLLVKPGVGSPMEPVPTLLKRPADYPAGPFQPLIFTTEVGSVQSPLQDPPKTFPLRGIKGRSSDEDIAEINTTIPVAGGESVSELLQTLQPSKGKEIAQGGSDSSKQSLLRQGDPSRYQIVRDTTSFRKRVEDMGEEKAERELLLNLVLDLTSSMKKVVERQDSIEKAVLKLENAFSVALSRASYSDLSNREFLNRTVLASSSSDVKITPPPLKQPELPQSDAVDSFVKLLRGPLPQGSDFEGMSKRIKSLLVESGETAFAENVTASTLRSNIGRARVAERLSKVPRKS